MPIPTFAECDDRGFAVIGINHEDWIFGYCAIRIESISTYSGKTEPKSPEYPKTLGENLVEDLNRIVANYELQNKYGIAINSIKALRHDIDNFGDLVYNQAELLYKELSTKFDRTDRKVKISNNIVYLSELIISRTFLTMFVNSPLTKLLKEPVQPYKGFDTIIRAFMPYADHKDILFKFNDKNNVKSEISSYEKPLFNTIPFIIIDNAIKYSPRSHEIKFSGKENATEIWFEIESTGPMLLEHERSKIFSFEFRGDQAQKHTDDGSGIGLHTLKVIVEAMHHGKVDFKQDYGRKKSLNKIDYVPTTITVKFPIK